MGALTLPLPHPNVEINPGRLGPPRLSARERKVLASVEDESLRKVLGESFISQRGVQANFDEIRMQFPIQPANLADDARIDKELGEGEPGEVLATKEGGGYEWTAAGSEPPLFSYSIATPTTWAAKAGQRVAYYKWSPGGGFGRLATVLVVAVADGTAKPTDALTEVKIGGEEVLSPVNVNTGGPTISMFYSSALQRFTRPPGSWWIKFTRSIEAAEKTATKIAVLTIATRGSHGAASAAALPGEEAPTYWIKILRAAGPIFAFAGLSAEKENLPTARSGTAVLETTAGYAAGKTGVAAVQFWTPTEALEKEWTNEAGSEFEKLSWTFAAAQSNVQREGYLLAAAPPEGLGRVFLE